MVRTTPARRTSGMQPMPIATATTPSPTEWVPRRLAHALVIMGTLSAIGGFLAVTGFFHHHVDTPDTAIVHAEEEKGGRRAPRLYIGDLNSTLYLTKKFHHVFRPPSCAYQFYSNESLARCLAPGKRLLLVGDSTMRGHYRDLYRIYKVALEHGKGLPSVWSRMNMMNKNSKWKSNKTQIVEAFNAWCPSHNMSFSFEKAPGQNSKSTVKYYLNHRPFRMGLRNMVLDKKKWPMFRDEILRSDIVVIGSAEHDFSLPKGLTPKRFRHEVKCTGRRRHKKHCNKSDQGDSDQRCRETRVNALREKYTASQKNSFRQRPLDNYACMLRDASKMLGELLRGKPGLRIIWFGWFHHHPSEVQRTFCRPDAMSEWHGVHSTSKRANALARFYMEREGIEFFDTTLPTDALPWNIHAYGFGGHYDACYSWKAQGILSSMITHMLLAQICGSDGVDRDGVSSSSTAPAAPVLFRATAIPEHCPPVVAGVACATSTRPSLEEKEEKWNNASAATILPTRTGFFIAHLDDRRCPVCHMGVEEYVVSISDAKQEAATAKRVDFYAHERYHFVDLSWEANALVATSVVQPDARGRVRLSVSVTLLWTRWSNKKWDDFVTGRDRQAVENLTCDDSLSAPADVYAALSWDNRVKRVEAVFRGFLDVDVTPPQQRTSLPSPMCINATRGMWMKLN